MLGLFIRKIGLQQRSWNYTVRRVNANGVECEVYLLCRHCHMQCLNVCGFLRYSSGEGDGALLIGVSAVRADGGGGHARRVMAHVGLRVGAVGAVLSAVGCIFQSGGFVADDESRVERR